MMITSQIKETSKALAGMLEIKEEQLVRIMSYHASHVPGEEREDIVQTLAEHLIKTKPGSGKLAFVICKHLIADWWRNYAATRQFETFGLYDVLDDNEGITLEETLSLEYEYVKRLDNDIDAENLLKSLPKDIQVIIQKRLLGLGTSDTERSKLHRFIESNPVALA
jgi:hypothetical protein